MTLLICVFAAIIATVKWYQRKDDSMMFGVPCVLFWGASLMWLGDAIFGYLEDGAAFLSRRLPRCSMTPISASLSLRLALSSGL